MASIAGLLSALYVGLGQVYNGQPVAGAILMITWFYALFSVCVILMGAGLHSALGQVSLLSLLGLWLLSVFQALRRAGQIKRGEVLDRRQLSTAFKLCIALPGAGQIYKREVLKGVAIIVLYLGTLVAGTALSYGGFLVSFFTAVFPGASPPVISGAAQSLTIGKWLLFTAFALWLIGIIDALAVSLEEPTRE